MRRRRATTSRTKSQSFRTSVFLLAAIILLSTIYVLQSFLPSSTSTRHRPLLENDWDYRATVEPLLGPYGELMLSFVRSDLPFTLFIPRPSVLESILLPTNNRHNASHITSQNVFISPKSNAYAVISRIFGFSAVPFRIFSGMVAVDSEMIYESVSGFRLNLIKATPKGTLTVNNLDCITVDIMKGSVVVHIVDGILMDADFEQSIMPLQDDMEDDYGMP